VPPILKYKMDKNSEMHTRLSQEHPPFLVSNSEHGYGIYTAPFHLLLRGAAGEQIKMKEVVFPESCSKKLTYQ